MPTEFEFKYAIDLSIADRYSHKDLICLTQKHVYIKQGFLAFSKGMSARVRCQTFGNKDQWYFTFKQNVSKRVVEIEQQIDDRDGKDLWRVCIGKLKKVRYFCDNKGITWELDLFKEAGGKLYFVLAEVELPEGESRPQKVPSFLKEFILYEVPLTDDRFANKKLGDVEYAKDLYKKIKEIS